MPDQEEQQQQQQGQRPPSQSTYQKGMVRDNTDSVLPEGVYTHALNAVVNTPDGQANFGLSTESANIVQTIVPYTLIGAILLHADIWWLFSTNNTNGEIGQYIESTGSYTTLLNDIATTTAGLPGFNFSTSWLITGAARRNFDCGFNVYFADGLNFNRGIDSQYLYPNPWIQSCTTVAVCVTCVNTNKIDINAIRLSPQYTIPCLKLAKGQGGGTLLNGQYMIATRFAINGIGCTDFTVSNSQSIFAHDNEAGSVVLSISGINTETTVIFPELEVVVISMVNSQVQAKRLGIFDSTTQTIYVDNLNQELINIDLKLIPLSTPIIDKSDAIFPLSNYLTLVGPYEKPEFNYQPLANQIVANWICVQYPGNYYHQGGLNGFSMNVSSMRGERYAYFIQWVYTTGDKSASYSIPGLPGGTPATLVLGGPSVGDGGVTVAHGRFAGYSSTYTYPNNEPAIWGALCGQPIMHHQFPDQTTFGGTILSHYTANGEIQVMGTFFDNIQPPVDINGNIIPNIQGYEILRATRDGNKSILAKGQINHMRGYKNADGTVGLYQNYPYDDLNHDHYLTSSQTVGTVGGTHDDWPANDANVLSYVSDNIISFHSPDTTFKSPYLGPGILTFDEVMAGTAVGQFDIPYKHPMFKLLTDRATALGTLISVSFTLLEAISIASGGSMNLDFAATTELPMTTPLSLRTYPDGSGGLDGDAAYIAGSALSLIAFSLLLPIQVKVLQTQYMNVVNGMVPGAQYARQYNSHGYYDTPYPANGIYQYNINDYEYIKGHLQTFGDFNVNNLYRNPYVAVNFNGSVPNFPYPYNFVPLPPTYQNYASAITIASPGAVAPTTCDRSRFTLGQAPNGTFGPFLSPIVSWYGSYKVSMAGQYGEVDSPKQVPIGCMQVVNPITGPAFYTSTVLFGGDIYINRYTEKNPMMFFNDWLVDQPEDYQYDYTQYENVPYPRYWINNSKIYYDFWAQASKNWHLDELPSIGPLEFWVKGGGYFYLFNNGVRDFFVESEVNVGYRDWDDVPSKRFYDPYGYTNIPYLFRSDIIKSDPFYKYDYSLSAGMFWNQWLSWSQCLDRDYNPILAYTCQSHYPRRVNYSLPQEEELKKDNWKIFLPNNYKDFPTNVISIKNLSNTGAIFFQDDAPPLILQGTASIPSKNGTEYTVGTGELFHQTLQQVTNVDEGLQYGSCQSRLSVVSTPYGMLWASQNTGKIFQYAPNKIYYNQGEAMIDIATHGLKFDLSLYMPSQLLMQFPDYPLKDNPVVGIGMQLIYDNTNEILYICKKDYRLNDNYSTQIVKNSENGPRYVRMSSTGQFYYNNGFVDIPIHFNESLYFTDCSWTLSYNLKNKNFISFHSWVPALNIPAKTHFLTTDTVYGNGNTLWRHNLVTNLFCNFYNQQFAFEVEYPIITGVNVTTLESITVFLEAYQYNNSYVNKFHEYANFFDYCLIYNSEQCSLPILMVLKPWDNPQYSLSFPFQSAAGNNVYYTKQEQKYRIGMCLKDYTDDRGEFTLTTLQPITRLPDWKSQIPTPGYLNPAKPVEQLKKIRHYKSRIFLRKVNPGTTSMTIYIAVQKLTESKR